VLYCLLFNLISSHLLSVTVMVLTELFSWRRFLEAVTLSIAYFPQQNQ